MTVVLALVIGGLYTAGFYLMMRRSIMKLIIGISLLTHAANLLLFTGPGLVRANAPVVPRGATLPEVPFADPLPQALILTAIVINFGVQAFAMVLFGRTHQAVRTEDLDTMKATDR